MNTLRKAQRSPVGMGSVPRKSRPGPSSNSTKNADTAKDAEGTLYDWAT